MAERDGEKGTVCRCEHDEPIATRSESGVWTFHDSCIECRFGPKPTVRGICGVIAPNQGPNGEPLACAWRAGHLPATAHSWAWVPTAVSDRQVPSDG